MTIPSPTKTTKSPTKTPPTKTTDSGKPPSMPDCAVPFYKWPCGLFDDTNLPYTLIIIPVLLIFIFGAYKFITHFFG
jgi:hypothetical protein